MYVNVVSEIRVSLFGNSFRKQRRRIWVEGKFHEICTTRHYTNVVTCFLILPTETRRSMQNHYEVRVWVFVPRQTTWWRRYDENYMTRRGEYGVCEITIDDSTGAYYYKIRIMYDRLNRWFRVVFYELRAGGTWTKRHYTRTCATGGHSVLDTARRLLARCRRRQRHRRPSSPRAAASATRSAAFFGSDVRKLRPRHSRKKFHLYRLHGDVGGRVR